MGRPDIGLHFSQQIGTAASVVDGYVTQRSLHLAVETKLSEHFSLGQLKRHLSIFREGRYFDLKKVLGGPVPADLPVLAATLGEKSWE